MNRAWTVWLATGGFLTVSMLVPFGPATEPSNSALAWRPTLLLPPTIPFGQAEFETPDAWGGETRLALVDQRFVMPGALPGQATRQPVLIPHGAHVLPGTRELVVSVEQLDGGGIPLTLEYRSADDRTGSLAFEGPGTRSMHVFEGMNDWHLDPDSRWSFTAMTESQMGVRLVIRIEMVRAAEPPQTVVYSHVWAGRTGVTLWDQKGDLEDASGLGDAPTGLLVKQPGVAPRLGRVPPVGVQWLDVILHYNSSSDKDLHYRPLLSWRGADVEAPAWELTGVAPSTVHRANHDGIVEWRLPVEPRMWDSLFARQTRWALQVDWSGDAAAYHMAGDYHFQVVAGRLPMDQSVDAS